MRLIVALLGCFCAYQASQAVATEPPVQTAAPAKQSEPATPAASASAPSAATPASSSPPADSAASKTTASSAKEVPADINEHWLAAQGYKPEVYKGTTIYCRKEAQTNTYFKTKVCSTREQLELAQRNSQDALKKMQTPRGGPGSN